jgi:hypothetical protein
MASPLPSPPFFEDDTGTRELLSANFAKAAAPSGFSAEVLALTRRGLANIAVEATGAV